MPAPAPWSQLLTQVSILRGSEGSYPVCQLGRRPGEAGSGARHPTTHMHSWWVKDSEPSLTLHIPGKLDWERRGDGRPRAAPSGFPKLSGPGPASQRGRCRGRGGGKRGTEWCYIPLCVTCPWPHELRDRVDPLTHPGSGPLPALHTLPGHLHLRAPEGYHSPGGHTLAPTPTQPGPAYPRDP